MYLRDEAKRALFEKTLNSIILRGMSGATHSKQYRRLRRRLQQIAHELPPGYVSIPRHLVDNVPCRRAD
jgi:hypothetical protein